MSGTLRGPCASQLRHGGRSSSRKSAVSGVRTITSTSHRRRQPPTDLLPPRWLSETKSRIGRCILFGMTEAQVTRAGLLLSELSRDWRSLLAGSEGFLTHPHRAGILSMPIDWGSQDSMGHVNNVQYVRYCETGRTNWTRQIGTHFDPAHKTLWSGMLTSKGYGLILRSIRVDYKFPMTWPDRISVFHKFRKMPGEKDDHMLLDVMILSEGKQRVAARAEEDIVTYDYKRAEKSPLPEFMLAQFRRQFEEQEASKRENSNRVREILKEVRELEMETWDRKDAKEDFGSAR